MIKKKKKKKGLSWRFYLSCFEAFKKVTLKSCIFFFNIMCLDGFSSCRVTYDKETTHHS